MTNLVFTQAFMKSSVREVNSDYHINTASVRGKQLKATQKLALYGRFIIDNRILGTF